MLFRVQVLMTFQELEKAGRTKTETNIIHGETPVQVYERGHGRARLCFSFASSGGEEREGSFPAAFAKRPGSRDYPRPFPPLRTGAARQVQHDPSARVIQ